MLTLNSLRTRTLTSSTSEKPSVGVSTWFRTVKATKHSTTLKRSSSRSLATSRPEFAQKSKKQYSKFRPLPNDVLEQIKKDTVKKPNKIPESGPRSGTPLSRETAEQGNRYPEHFKKDVENVEAESKQHLEKIQAHFVNSLGLKFEDWELVQTALTHYSYSEARKVNDGLSRVGEKALRFILMTEMTTLNPTLAKQSWYLTANVRFLSRFEFLATYIESTLQLGALTRSREPNAQATYSHQIRGKELAQYHNSVIAKSILAIVGVIYKTQGEPQARDFVRTLFIDPYKDESGAFQAPVLQPIQIRQTGGL